MALGPSDFDFLVMIVITTFGLCSTVAQRISLMFGLGMSNNGTGLVLASIALANHPQVMLPLISYNLIQQLMAGGGGRMLLRKAVL